MASNYSSDTNSIEDSIKVKKQISNLKNLKFDKPGKKQVIEAGNDATESTRPKRKPKQRERFDNYLNDAPLYDADGLLNISKQDICDCLRADCPGCHFPCKQCNSSKCGNKCRSYRNWFYKRIEYEGSSHVLNMQHE